MNVSAIRGLDAYEEKDMAMKAKPFPNGFVNAHGRILDRMDGVGVGEEGEGEEGEGEEGEEGEGEEGGSEGEEGDELLDLEFWELDNFQGIDSDESIAGIFDGRFGDEICPRVCRKAMRRTLYCRWEIPACRFFTGRRRRRRARWCPFLCRRSMRLTRTCQNNFVQCAEFDIFGFEF